MEPLYVVTAFSNPLLWKSRVAAHKQFEDALLKAPQVRLTTVECAYGERPFQLPPREGVQRVQVRAKTMAWIKENLINIGVSRLPPGWKYLAWIDGDVIFRQDNWADTAVHGLQLYDVLQPWSDAYDLGPKDEHLASYRSFCRQYKLDQPVIPKGEAFWTFNGGKYYYPHSGYAWCCTRQAFEWLGGLLDIAMLGHGDHHMALGLVGEAWYSLPKGVTHNYSDAVNTWQARAIQHINKNIGFTWGTLEHLWHGRKAQRQYVERWDVIIKDGFDPHLDLKRNSFGVYELTGRNPRLTHDIDTYMRQRNEDANSID
jgi:hypothetical protein